MKKLGTLTKEQEALLPIYRQKWLNIGYSTNPIDREQTIKSIKWLYKLFDEG